MEEVDAMHSVTDAAANAANETVGKVATQFVDFVQTFVTWGNLFKVVGAVFMIFIMWLVFKLVKHAVKKIPPEKIEKHYVHLILRFISYTFYILVVMYILSLFGVKLKAIWGAAGIAGVAIGFAAQTSVSNLISGLFVLSEKTMKVGDFIEVGGVAGTVDAIGLLSVKVHTLDNQMIRIPNSSIINSNFQNNNYFSERRFQFKVSVDYSTNMTLALKALESVPAKCSTVLKTPAPAVWYDGFGDSGIEMVLAVWFKPSDIVQMKNEVYMNIKQAFDEVEINIPFNRLDVAMVK